MTRVSFGGAAVACAAWLVLLPMARAAEPILAGYSDFAAFAAQVAELDKSEFVTARSLGKTGGGRDVWLVTVATGEVDKKPAILVLGNVDPQYLAGSELALRMARQLAGGNDAAALLGRVTFYFIPRPDPDGSERCFAKLLIEPKGNARPTDDDRDGKIGEDPPDDLDGNGVITQMRIADDTGAWKAHPDDPRVLIRVDPKKNERGEFRVLTEGRDDDGDEEWNEDGASGVAFNRNWTHNFPGFKINAGPNAVSEPETRAVADFAFDHPNIAAVFCFSPEDNLFNPWKTGPGSEGRFRKQVLAGDVDYLGYLAEKYKKTHGGSDAPGSPGGEGSFSEWAYFHYGRWSLAARAWWVPKVAEEKPAEKPPEGTPEKKKSEETRAADDLNALRYFAKEKLDGFVPWKEVKHPDFPDKKVEVGGFKPLYRTLPQAKELDGLATKHTAFLRELTDHLPKIALRDVIAEKLGGGVYRVKATAVNTGYLPTMAEMGRVDEEGYPLQLELVGEKLVFLQSSQRTKLGILAGSGGKREHTWLVRTSEANPQFTVKLHAPAVGTAEAKAEIRDPKP